MELISKKTEKLRGMANGLGQAPEAEIRLYANYETFNQKEKLGKTDYGNDSER
jgi:hypothetical protein